MPYRDFLTSRSSGSFLKLSYSQNQISFLTRYRLIDQLVDNHFFAQVLESLILKRKLRLFSENKIPPDHQFDFRAKHSTIHHVHGLVDSVSFALKKNIVLYLCFS